VPAIATALGFADRRRSVDGSSVRDALADDERTGIHRQCARLIDGLERCGDWNLRNLSIWPPGRRGMAPSNRSHERRRVPILVIGSPDDKDVATQVLARGGPVQRDASTTAARLDRSSNDKRQKALFFEQQRANVTLNSISDAVLTISQQRDYLNPVAERMTGWPVRRRSAARWWTSSGLSTPRRENRRAIPWSRPLNSTRWSG
jgi:PAS domain-containing protein